MKSYLLFFLLEFCFVVVLMSPTVFKTLLLRLTLQLHLPIDYCMNHP